MIKICVTNHASHVPFGVSSLVAAMQSFCDLYFTPAWNIRVKIIHTIHHVKGYWSMVLLDDADAPGALAYHTVDGMNNPLAKVFVKTILNAGESVSVAATHELAEMLADPNCARTAVNGSTQVAYEVCDPVEESTFEVMGFLVSDFVLPAYFNAKATPGTPVDHLGVITKPFEIAPGGYQSVLDNGQWTEVFGSEAKAQRFALEDRRGHRSEYRRLRQLEHAAAEAQMVAEAAKREADSAAAKTKADAEADLAKKAAPAPPAAPKK